MTSHIDSTLHFNKHHVTEFGMPVLDDIDTNDIWWAQREGVWLELLDEPIPGHIHALVADLDALAPARWVREDDSFTGSLREPDFYDEGKAYWLTPDAVVAVDVDRIGEVESILGLEPRIKPLGGDRIGWVRIHPSHYGIEVNAFDGTSHDAHSAWSHLSNAIKSL